MGKGAVHGRPATTERRDGRAPGLGGRLQRPCPAGGPARLEGRGGRGPAAAEVQPGRGHGLDPPHGRGQPERSRRHPGAAVRGTGGRDRRAGGDVGERAARARARRLSASPSALAAVVTEVSIRELGTLGGAVSQAKAVNRQGHVVGTSRDALGRSRAFLWTAELGIADLRPLSGVNSSANDISEPGEIAGGGDTGFGDFHAYLLSEGTGFDLGTLGGNESEALAVNRLGQVAGHSRISGGVAKHAFFVPEPGRMLDLGSLGGATSIAHDVNNRSEVVGGSGRAFLWSQQAGIVDLGTLGGRTSCANDVNDLGYIVGASQTGQTDRRGQPVTRAFLRTPDGQMLDLGTLGGEHSSAAAVSGGDGGQLWIAGHSHDGSA